MKSKNYLKNIIALQSGTGGIKCNDVPWPYSVDVVEIKNVMFHDVLTDDHKYKKPLREEQIRWFFFFFFLLINIIYYIFFLI
jgi:hypothetical protein